LNWSAIRLTVPATPISTSSRAAVAVRELTQPSDRELWDNFVGAVPEGDVLQAWEWGGVKGADWRPIRYGVFRGEEIVGGAAILCRKLPVVGNFFYAPRGPLLKDWTDAEALKALLAAIKERGKKEGAAFLKIDPAVPIEREDVAALLKAQGFAPPPDADPQGFGGTQPRCVMQLDLAGRTLEQILAACKSQARRNIKLSTEKHGVRLVENPTRDDLKVFNELMKITGERDGFRPRGLGYFETIWDNLVPAGLAKLFLTEYEGERLSGALCFIIGDKAWYVYGASSNEHRNVMPNYAMQWAMIRWAKEQGCTWYDFRGVSPRRKQEGESSSELEKEDHLQGLNRFKEGFGTRYVEYLGEFDLVYKPFAYWAYTNGKPTAQRWVRKIKSGGK
jgi:peptidoglycan pentaglycine glycine transferase (the first glycine)